MGNVLRIVVKTTLFYCLVILGATFLMFSLLWAAPGDISDVLCPRGCSPEMKAQLAKEWHLNEPLVVQYGRWLSNAARFRFGASVAYRQGEPVAAILKPAIRLTTLLVLGATALTLLLSFFLGWRPAHPVMRWGARVFQVPLMLLSFAPLYMLAYWVVMLSSRFPHWLVGKGHLSQKTLSFWHEIDFMPFGQQVSDEAPWIYLVVAFFVAILLLALGNNNLVEQSSGVQAELTQLKAQGFMRAVRARGASYTKHLLHNFLLPLTQFFTARAILLLGTVVIIETVMNITGIGWLLWEAAKQRDTPLVLAIALFATVMACVLQMINEIALKLVDPRLREQR